jgi:hypothetical protein
MRKSNFALRLQPSLLEEARKLAEAEGVALNQLINVAVAEKVSALRTECYITERAARANLPKALTPELCLTKSTRPNTACMASQSFYRHLLKCAAWTSNKPAYTIFLDRVDSVYFTRVGWNRGSHRDTDLAFEGEFQNEPDLNDGGSRGSRHNRRESGGDRNRYASAARRRSST